MYGNRLRWSYYQRWQLQHLIGFNGRVRYRSIAYKAMSRI